MRFLCVCNDGYVRSAAMAFMLRGVGEQEAIAVGHDWATPETMMFLCMWADKVVCMKPEMIDYIPENLRPKAIWVDVGDDVYSNPLDPELTAKAREGARWLLSNGTDAT